MAQCKDDTLNFFEKENRPYSLIDVCGAIKTHGKSAIGKAIDELCQEGLIKEKTYGKQKVYVYDQARLPTVNEAELHAMEAEVASLSSKLSDRQDKLRCLNMDYKKLTSSLTLEEAQNELKQVTEELANATKEVNRLKAKGPSVTEEEFKSVSVSREKFATEWRKRKRMAMDIVDAVAEGYPKSRKQLITDVGIETDEDCGVTMPSRS